MNCDFGFVIGGNTGFPQMARNSAEIQNTGYCFGFFDLEREYRLPADCAEWRRNTEYRSLFWVF